MKVLTNVPAFIEVSEKEESRYTKAKLKIFYKGLTGDNRLFTSDFSDELLKTISYTPVVGYYDEEDEDFKGHNSVQFVYGVVPDDAVNNVHYKEEEGKTFAVVDVILFTEREDNIGKVARKIVGKQHSLELNPNTLKYKINRDDQGRFLNIEFLHGEFIGLSVLGDNERPAFAGSGFFSEENFDATKCVETFKNFLQFLNQDGGSIEVFNFEDYLAKTADSFKLAQTMQGFIQSLYEALEAKEVYGYIVENTTEYAVVSTWDNENNRAVYRKYSIAEQEDGKISVGDYVEVFPRFLTEEEINAVNNADPTFQSEDPATTGDPAATCTEQPTTEESEFTNGEEDQTSSTQTDESDPEPRVGQMSEPTTSVSSATLTDSERSELDSFRRAAKEAKVAEYTEDIGEEAISRIMASLDSYSMDELEVELNKEYRKAVKTAQAESAKTPTIFSVITTAPDYHEDRPEDVVNKYKN
jgi:hypothetical protein